MLLSGPCAGAGASDNLPCSCVRVTRLYDALSSAASGVFPYVTSFGHLYQRCELACSSSGAAGRPSVLLYPHVDLSMDHGVMITDGMNNAALSPFLTVSRAAS